MSFPIALLLRRAFSAEKGCADGQRLNVCEPNTADMGRKSQQGNSFEELHSVPVTAPVAQDGLHSILPAPPSCREQSCLGGEWKR